MGASPGTRGQEQKQEAGRKMETNRLRERTALEAQHGALALLASPAPES